MRPEPYDRGDEILNRRTTTVRTILFLIILGTLPLYLVGFLLWATAPADDGSGSGLDATPTIAGTFTPIGSDATATEPRPTNTPFPTLPGPLATPRQFATSPNRIPTSSGPVFPQPTLAPTLTFPPTFAPPTVMATTIPLPTVVIPTNTQPPAVPTNTDVPAPTATQVIPTNTVAPQPTSTDAPLATTIPLVDPTPTLEDTDGGAGPAP